MGFRKGVFAAFLVQSALSANASLAQPANPSVGATSQPRPAQNVSTDIEDLPVMARPRPEYDPMGIPVGGFLLFPQLTVDGTYDSNVFRTPETELDDYFFTFSPSLRLRSNWGRHSLEFYGGVDAYEYLKYTQENLADWDTGADGRYDIAEGISLYGNGLVAEEHESLASPNVLGNQKSPTRYYDKHAEVSATAQPNRLGFSAGGSFDHYDYLNTPLIGGGQEDNGDRDFDDYQAFAKSFYDLSPGYSLFLRTSYESRQFDQYFDRNGLHRSSTGYHADAGGDLQLSHLVSGEVYLGYLKYDFSGPLLNVGGLDYGAKLDWLATPLITVHLEGGRMLNQVILVGASIQDSQSVGVSADYEFRRNLIVQARADYVDSSYPGIVRHDKAPDAGIGVKYLLTQLLSLEANYTYTGRSTNALGGSFHDNEITVGINLHP